MSIYTPLHVDVVRGEEPQTRFFTYVNIRNRNECLMSREWLAGDVHEPFLVIVAVVVIIVIVWRRVLHYLG